MHSLSESDSAGEQVLSEHPMENLYGTNKNMGDSSGASVVQHHKEFLQGLMAILQWPTDDIN